ncbi:hypothetical protein Leryth_008559 [Lithospermum erythrorhizon]|nr:hypothetical protein Leryth_008559 [Lithospermum erythrorhizon]
MQYLVPNDDFSLKETKPSLGGGRLLSGGVMKMGNSMIRSEFSCSAFLNMLQMYTQPLLPKLHYTHPLTTIQIDLLRHQATHIVATRRVLQNCRDERKWLNICLMKFQTCGVFY